MTLALSGTNGLLQSVDYPTLTTGFTYNWPSGYTTAVFNPGGTLANGTINFPTSSLVEGMVITFSSSQQITALSLSGGSASIVGAVTFLPAKTGVSYVYRATGTTWYPTATVPGTGSQLVQGTSVASTSGTSIDFTGIPSWVKRITVMLNGVSTSGTVNVSLQIGSGSVETSGYVGSSARVTSTPAAAWDSVLTTMFQIGGYNANTDTLSGAAILNLIGSNIWTLTGSVFRSSGVTSAICFFSGGKTTSGTLDRVRITTTNGTDTFDAGSINILYE